MEDTAENTQTSAESADAATDAAEAEERRSGGRDLPVSTLIHLLGLPTSGEVMVLESKIDMLMAKMTALSAKVDRLSNQIGTIANEYYIDRIDFQIAEIRTLMKKVFPSVVSGSDFVSGPIRERKKKTEDTEKEAAPSPSAPVSEEKE